MAKQRRDVWVCDAILCDKEEPAGEDAPRGYSGIVSTEGGTGCYKEPWYACTKDHIEPAITEVARRAHEKAYQ